VNERQVSGEATRALNDRAHYRQQWGRKRVDGFVMKQTFGHPTCIGMNRSKRDFEFHSAKAVVRNTLLIAILTSFLGACIAKRNQALAALIPQDKLHAAEAFHNGDMADVA
jgi:hypothetical protein